MSGRTQQLRKEHSLAHHAYARAYANARTSPILVTPLPIVTDVSPEQPENVPCQQSKPPHHPVRENAASAKSIHSRMTPKPRADANARTTPILVTLSPIVTDFSAAQDRNTPSRSSGILSPVMVMCPSLSSSPQTCVLATAFTPCCPSSRKSTETI